MKGKMTGLEKFELELQELFVISMPQVLVTILMLVMKYNIKTGKPR